MNTADYVQVVTFRLGSQEFAFDILQIERILRYEPPAPLPKAPPFLEGVMPYAGGAVPVVDLRKRFELQAPIREETRAMVLDLGSRPGRTIIILNARKLLTSTERLSLTGVGA
ncbi:MAG: chemotaxis protein CheW [Gemmatimonadetes bacterium]|nr:chemotaxis protein CheW [Gemmatimonadota bacterium]